MMEKYITDERTGLKYELVGEVTITWLSEMMSRRKIGRSGYGGSGISAISESATVCDMPIC